MKVNKDKMKLWCHVRSSETTADFSSLCWSAWLQQWSGAELRVLFCSADWSWKGNVLYECNVTERRKTKCVRERYHRSKCVRERYHRSKCVRDHEVKTDSSFSVNTPWESLTCNPAQQTQVQSADWSHLSVCLSVCLSARLSLCVSVLSRRAVRWARRK